MDVTLRPATAERIRAVLGEDVDLAPGAVPAVLARLAVEAPAVYSEVLSQISGSDVRLDSERELQRRHRRGALRRLLFGWGEYESEAGDRLIAKRRVAAAVPLGAAGAMLALLAVSAAVGHRPAPRPGQAAQPAAAIRRASASDRHPATTARTPAHRPAAWSGGRKTPEAARERPDLVRSGSAPLPPLPPVPPVLAALPPAPPALSAGSPPAAIVFTREQPSVPADGGAGARPAPPIVYDRAAETAGSSAGVAGRAAQPPAVVLDLSSSPAPVGASATPAAPAQPASTPAGVSLGGPHPPAAEPHAVTRPARPRWAVGQRIAARLATGVVAIAGGPPLPVAAESDDPAATWLGSATVGPDGLVQITLSPATPDAAADRPGGVRGIALDPARLSPGLPGRTTLRQPRAAGALVAAMLQGAADYVQALAQQGQVTLVGGWAQVATGAPAPAWTYLAARLAQGMGVRGSAAGPIETTELDAGTRVEILVTEAP